MDPPPALRGRILDAIAAERTSAGPEERADIAPQDELPDNVARDARRTNVVPLRPRMQRPGAYLAAGLAIAACLVIGLGLWNVSLHNQLGDSRQALRTAPLQGANGSVVIGAGSNGVLVVSNLATAPAGKTYEAWVIQDSAPVPAGTFDGGGTVAVRLERPVPGGAVVAVTVERAGGVDQPTSKPIITSSPI
jgi:anti-sigma-K factor RskA